MSRGGINPLAIGWEKAVLGTALYDPETMAEAEDLLPSDLSGCHQIIWGEMLALHRRQSLDIRALVEALRSSNQLEAIASFDTENVVGETYISELLASRGAAMNEYVDRVMNFSLKRELSKIAGFIQADAQDENVDGREAAEEAERRLVRLRRSRANDGASTLADLLATLNHRIDGFRDGSIVPSWVPELLSIREVVDYIDADDFVIVAARPGEGKSSLMRHDFVNSAMHGTGGLIFNLENGDLEYAKYAVSMVAKIDSDKLKSPSRLTEEELYAVREASENLARIPLFIKTLGAPSAAEIERITRYHIMQHDVKRIGVDYVQLMNNGIESKVLDVSKSSGTLRAIALNYGIPVMANSQMSRNIIHRGQNAEPELSDLRDSGSLEQDATMVWFPREVWREPTQTQLRMFPENVNPNNGIVYTIPRAVPIRIKIAKNRNGKVGKTGPVLWVKSINDFRPLTGFEEVE